MEIPPLIFDKLWRSKYATEKYITKVLSEKINFSEKHILDFGCGTGSYSFLFNPNKYLGVDVCEKRIIYAQKHYPRYKFQKIDINKFEIKKGKFDYIFIVSVLHHLNNEINKKYIKYFFKVLNNDGAIIGMEPCLFSNTPFNNWFMEFIDRGKFIKTEKGYKLLFKNLFLFKTQKKYTRHFAYNELFYIAHKTI
ncbi:class I SAM-dependent methyltransferase [Candidatus Parcubacteria bacterium]|nr:class I SAM-dependent methyltransferase [Candidatus Parcubacteria bacterium]